MRFISKPVLRCAPLLIAGMLAACASPPDGNPADKDAHKAHHPETVASSGHRPGAGGAMDRTAMCGRYEKMISQKTPADREAMMDRHMKSMPPEMQQRHMEMMQEKCR